MTDIASLYALTGCLFVAALCVFLLLIYKLVTTEKISRCLIDASVFVLLVFIDSYIAGASLNGKINDDIKIPDTAIIFISVFFTAYAAIGFFMQRKRNRNQLLPSSVKEALDNLNSGICFTDESGKVVLINYVMSALISSALGSYPQTHNEIKNALNECEDLGNNLYRFSDGRVWLIRTVSLEQETLIGFMQTTAQDVTELYETNNQLQTDNERLKETNEEIQKMMERLADRIREQETLNLKMRIHDDIGTSLIAINNIMNGKSDETLDEQLNVLQNAVGYFSNELPKHSNTLESIIKSAADMGVQLMVSGTIYNDKAERLIALAARECVTNCIKHAGGNEVYIKLGENSAVFTNNGKQPKGRIAEGGGLSSLRKQIENAGGEMRVEISPRFMLILNLPERSSPYD